MVKEVEILGEIQGGFRRGRRTEDIILFMLERLIEMVKGRKEEIFVAFLDMEKAYDRVNRKKLFEVMRCYGVHEKLVRLIERIHDGSLVKFECKCYDMVRRRWLRTCDVLEEKERTMDVIKGYVEVNNDVENETLKYLGEEWTERQRNERNRVNGYHKTEGNKCVLSQKDYSIISESMHCLGVLVKTTLC